MTKRPGGSWRQSVIFNLLLLGFFKYGTFLADNLYLLTGIQIPESVQLLGLTIPLLERVRCPSAFPFIPSRP